MYGLNFTWYLSVGVSGSKVETNDPRYWSPLSKLIQTTHHLSLDKQSQATLFGMYVS